ncbi:MAG: flagellar hook-basal body complex protein [Planctomycetales bacterium]|nr:flagellar hook-basal body complex protein [Planctomycetales bacterium]
MSRSLMTGITGLRTHQQKLDVVANNLANMNTVGFKSQSAIFSDLMYNVARGASAATEDSGGINPQAIGTGVQTAQIARSFSQGTLESTSNIFDFAIQGEGFFTLAGQSNDNVYSRAGAFSLDANGRLVDPSTGFLVQRIGDVGEGTDGGVPFQEIGESFINVPIGAPIAGEKSSMVNFVGNLPSSASPPIAEVLQSFTGFSTSGGTADGTTLLSDLTINTADYVAGDIIEISGTNPDGTPFSTTLAAETATLQDLVDSLNSALTGATAALAPDGTLSVTSDTTGEGFLSLLLRDASGNVGGSSFSANSMFLSEQGSSGDTFQLSMEVFDVRGESHRINFDFLKESANTWSVTADIRAESGVLLDDSVYNLTFNEDGSYGLAGLTGVGDANIEIQFNGITSTQEIALDFSGLSHLATDFSITQTQDGIPPGSLTSVAVSTTGELTGLASNGRAIPLAQLAIATFSNPNALDAVGNNYFKQSMSSGEASLGRGMAGNRGQIMGGQLERSNVDIAQEFTQLIVAQRGFSANARTITVSDQMLEELTNIIR